MGKRQGDGMGSAGMIGARRAVFLLAGAMALAACGQFVPSGHQTVERASLVGGAFDLDPDHATVLWKISHLGFSKVVGRFDEIEASLDFTPETPEQSRLEVIIETASVSTGNREFDEVLRGPEWFDVEAHPQAIFRSNAIEVTGETTGRITGDLTLLGRTAPITLDVSFNGGAANLITLRYTLGFEAHATFQRSAFGLDTLLPAIGDEVELEIHAEFIEG